MLEKRPRRPLHEVLPDLIRLASSDDLLCYGGLIVLTEIPKNHDQIAAAWKKRCADMGWGENAAQHVMDDLAAQKRAAEDKAAAKVVSMVHTPAAGAPAEGEPSLSS